MLESATNEGFPSDLLVDLRDAGGAGLGARLEEALRAGIRSGRLVPGSALPPSRVLATDLGISRSVVVEAYANLRMDGYLEARTGVGTRVRSGPGLERALRVHHSVSARDSPAGATEYRPARRPHPADNSPAIRLFGGLPDPSLFPRALWLRHYRAALSELPDPELTYPRMLGAPELRAALTGYLGRVRGVATTPDQVLVCSGFTQGLVLVCRVLWRRGARRLAVEDPCFGLHREAVELTGLEPVPVAVDERGIDTCALPDDVGGVLVAPAHSYPTGGTLDVDRRRSLLAWARRTGGLVIEDDYDAEFRYDRNPIGAIQGAAPERVVYVGCASKTFTPALRLGWVAAPRDLLDELEQEKCFDDMGSTLVDQVAFARLLDSGDFAAHLRRVRPIYRRRRDATIEALADHLPEVRWHGEAVGLHLYVTLPEAVDEFEFCAAAFERGVLVEDGAWHWAEPEAAPPSIVLGYGGTPEPSIRRGIAMLGDALRALDWTGS